MTRPVGRPSKGYEEFHTNLPGDVKEAIGKLAEALGISQGEAIAYVWRAWRASVVAKETD